VGAFGLISLRILSTSADHSRELGQALGEILRPGDLLALDGELGTGKTTFCNGIGVGLKIPEVLSSPSYLLCKEYDASLGPVMHLDAYFAQRLDSLLGEGLIEQFDPLHIVLIEWAERIQAWLPTGRLALQIELIEPETRFFCFRALGNRAQTRLEEYSQILTRKGISFEPGAESTR
jgi:tRNA threonylcarbamoyladenosine biosynthesis protein TsaE